MTKKLSLLTLALMSASVFSQIGINTDNPNASAALDVSSDTKGLIIPRLTTAAVTSLASTAGEGLIVYDKEKKMFFGWDGTKWQNLGFEGSGSSGSLQTGTIFSQGFETTSSLNYSTSGAPSSFAFTTGNSTNADGPSLTPMYSEGARGYGYSSAAGTTSYIEFNNVDASTYSNNITFSFDVASFSIGSTTNGADSNDFVGIEISTNGGTTYSPKLTLFGGNSSTGSNAKWAFIETGTGTSSYASSNLSVTSPSTSTSTNLTLTGAQAITKLSVTGIPNASQLKIRISVKNNAATEMWIIDNVKLQAL